MSATESRIPPGVRYMVLSALGFSIMALFVKLAGKRLPTQEIVLSRAVIGLALSYVHLRRRRISPWGTRRGLLVVRGFLGLAGLFCFFYSVTHLPLAEATVIHYVNPVLTALLAALVLKEALRPQVLLSAAACLAGVLLVYRPAFLFGAATSGLDLLTVTIGLGGACFSALAYITVRTLSRTEDPLVIVFYFPLVALPATLPTVIGVALWPTPLEWLYLLGVGLFTQVGQVFLTKGLQHEPAGKAMTIAYIQVFFASAWGVIFFGDRLTAGTIGGALLILLGVALLGLRRSGAAQRPPVAGPETLD